MTKSHQLGPGATRAWLQEGWALPGGTRLLQCDVTQPRSQPATKIFIRYLFWTHSCLDQALFCSCLSSWNASFGFYCTGRFNFSKWIRSGWIIFLASKSTGGSSYLIIIPIAGLLPYLWHLYLFSFWATRRFRLIKSNASLHYVSGSIENRN